MSKSILVIEDNATILKLYQLFFEDTGWQVFFARSGEEALELLQNLKADLILSDIRLPGKSGIETARIIREREACRGERRTPIIGTSAHLPYGEKEKCLQAGMDDLLPRPMRLDILMNCLSRHLAPNEPAMVFTG